MASLVVLSVILFLALMRGAVVSENRCNKLQNRACSCSIDTPTHYEVVCSSLMVVQINENENAQIQCMLPDNSSDFSVLSGLQVGDVSRLVLRHCPLPDTSIKDLMNSVGISKITNLQFQSFSALNNTLKKTHFNQLYEVKSLSLNSNGLTTLPFDVFEDMGNLTWLDMKYNYLVLPKEIFSFTPKLEVLELGNNLMTHLIPGIFKNLNHLRLLNLWGNNLVNLTRAVLSDVPNLESLDLHSNGIENISPDLFFDLLKLKILNLHANSFRTLPEGLLSRNTELAYFEIHENKKELQTLPSRLLSNLTNLKRVRLSGSKIMSLPGDVFSGSNNIVDLFLDRNLLITLVEEIFSDQKSLETLDLGRNDITVLPEKLFSNTVNLKVLKLNNNQLSGIAVTLFKELKNLEHLDLRGNKLVTISGPQLFSLHKLKTLYLSDNQLTSLQYASNDQLSDGHYSVLSNCYALENLQLGNNSLTEIYTDWSVLLTKLRHLNLSHNWIQSVEVKELYFISADVLIDLSNNNISVANFREMTYLSNALLVHSSGYDSDYYGLFRPKRVKLDNNPFNCDCQLFEFHQFVNRQVAPEVQALFSIPTEHLRCNQPENLKGTKLTSVPPLNLTCDLTNANIRYKIENMTTEYVCPSACTCLYRPHDNGNIINCRGENLQPPAALPLFPRANHTELVLIGVDPSFQLFKIPSDNGYDNVTSHLFS